MANRLSADPSKQVLLIEAGEDNKDLIVKARTGQTMSRADLSCNVSRRYLAEWKESALCREHVKVMWLLQPMFGRTHVGEVGCAWLNMCCTKAALDGITASGSLVNVL
jgi:hypothetical protein